MNLARSSYYQSGLEQENEHELQVTIETIAGEFPTYGSRRIGAQLRRTPYQMVVNCTSNNQFAALK